MNPITRARRKRRTRDEITRLVTDYTHSGLSRAAFCRMHQVSSATLGRYLERATPTTALPAPTPSFVAVEIAPAISTADSGLSLLLSAGRRVAIQRGFCADTLQHLLSVLERR